MENTLYDIIIIGAGPAGMTAAIYAGRANKSVTIIDKNGFGGNISLSPKVENIPGFISVSGADFTANMYEQMCQYENINHVISDVKFIDYKNGIYKVYIDDTFICGMSLIIATGAVHREFNLDTKDIYYCVTCDGPMFKNKNVVVVGSGNTGATYALELSTYCKNVYICDVTTNMCCESVLRERVEKTKNIFWKPNTTITSVVNKSDKLQSVMLSTGEVIKCNAIFAAIGLIPQTDVVKNFIKLDTKNYIISEDCTIDYMPGCFVAGDCRTSKVKQVTTATADGTIAAVNAINYINSLKN